MSNRNKHNSIVFLTTLSVYLGLVLIGAPPILAQAALTRNFDIQEEIEIKDNLDKKPDDFASEKAQPLKSDNQVILDFAQVVKILLEADWQANTNRFTSVSEAKSDFAGNLQAKRFFFTNFDPNEPNARQIFHTIHSVLYKLFKLFPARTSYDESNVIVSFKLNDKEFTTESRYLQKDGSDVQELLAVYSSNLEALKRQTVSEYQALILKHTKILAQNNQFVIVTRLPRGSLDELLKNEQAEK